MKHIKKHPILSGFLIFLTLLVLAAVLTGAVIMDAADGSTGEFEHRGSAIVPDGAGYCQRDHCLFNAEIKYALPLGNTIPFSLIVIPSQLCWRGNLNVQPFSRDCHTSVCTGSQ